MCKCACVCTKLKLRCWGTRVCLMPIFNFCPENRSRTMSPSRKGHTRTADTIRWWLFTLLGNSESHHSAREL